jgi:hypothetical protein
MQFPFIRHVGDDAPGVIIVAGSYISAAEMGDAPLTAIPPNA